MANLPPNYNQFGASWNSVPPHPPGYYGIPPPNFPPPNLSQPPPGFTVPPPSMNDAKSVNPVPSFNSNDVPYSPMLTIPYPQFPYQNVPPAQSVENYYPAYGQNASGAGNCDWDSRNTYRTPSNLENWRDSGNSSSWRSQESYESCWAESEKLRGSEKKTRRRNELDERKSDCRWMDRGSSRERHSSRKRSRSSEYISRSSRSRYSSSRHEDDRHRPRDRERYSKNRSTPRDYGPEMEDAGRKSHREFLAFPRTSTSTGRSREPSKPRRRSKSQDSHSSKNSLPSVPVASKSKNLSEREILLEKYRRHYCATSKDMERKLNELSAIGTDEIIENEKKVWTRTAPADLYYSRDENNPRIMRSTSKLKELCAIFKHFLLDRAAMARANQVSNKLATEKMLN